MGSKPFVIDVRSLGRRAGEMKQIHRTVTCHDRIGGDMVAIVPESAVDLDLRLQSVTEGVLVTGTVSGDTEGQCARCLDAVSGTVNIYLTELYAYPNSDTDATSDSEDVHRLEGDEIDLEQAVIDAVGLELPMSPTCRPDCHGLCPDCGAKLDDVGPDHGHDKIDPRWAGLVAKLETAEPAESAPAEVEPVRRVSPGSEAARAAKRVAGRGDQA